MYLICLIYFVLLRLAPQCCLSACLVVMIHGRLWLCLLYPQFQPLTIVFCLPAWWERFVVISGYLYSMLSNPWREHCAIWRVIKVSNKTIHKLIWRRFAKLGYTKVLYRIMLEGSSQNTMNNFGRRVATNSAGWGDMVDDKEVSLRPFLEPRNQVF